MANKEPTYGNGKLCYVEIPALDIKRSAEFYQTIFGWKVRMRDDGSTAFDDAVGEVSGSWVRNRKPATDPGPMLCIMVDSVATTCKSHVPTDFPIGGRVQENETAVCARHQTESRPAGSGVEKDVLNVPNRSS